MCTISSCGRVAERRAFSRQRPKRTHHCSVFDGHSTGTRNGHACGFGTSKKRRTGEYAINKHGRDRYPPERRGFNDRPLARIRRCPVIHSYWLEASRNDEHGKHAGHIRRGKKILFSVFSTSLCSKYARFSPPTRHNPRLPTDDDRFYPRSTGTKRAMPLAQRMTRTSYGVNETKRCGRRIETRAKR